MKKILLIEDEEDVVEILSKTLKLEHEEYEIHSAEDGQSGLEKVRKIRPDLILLDIMLPDLDGIEVCRSLKSDEEYKSIPVIMLTARDKSDNIIKGLSAGANDYVTKPFDAPELLARIKSHLTMKELYGTVKNDDEEKSALLDVSRSLSSSTDPYETLYIIVSKIAGAIEVKRCSIIYIDPLNKKGTVVASHDSKEIKQLKIDLNKYPEIQLLMKTGKPMIINDVYDDPILFSVRDVLNLIDIKSIMAFPVAFKDTLIGTLILRTSRREQPFNKREIRFCEVISHLAAAPLKNAYTIELLEKEKEQAEEALREVAQGVLISTGDMFFRLLVEHLTKALGMEFAFIGELTGKRNNIIRTIAACSNGKILENFEYPLANTPCENIIEKDICCHPEGVQQLFPKDNLLAEMQVESYLGTPLIDSEGIATGIIVLLGKKPIKNPEVTKSMLKIFAVRVVDELKRKIVMEELEKSEERYKNLVQTIPDIIYKIDPDGNFIFINRSIRDLGYEPNELIGKHFNEIIHPDDVESVKLSNILKKHTGKKTGDKKSPKVFDKRRTGKRITKGLEVRLIKKNWKRENVDLKIIGSITIVGDATASGLHDTLHRDQSKSLIGTVGIIRDITEHKRVEKIVESQQKQLLHADKMKSLGIMAAGVAHEINNPNSFIMFNAHILEKIWKDAVPVLENFNKDYTGLSLGGLPFSEACNSVYTLLSGINEGSRRIKNIVSELKDFVREESFSRESFINVNDVVNKAVGLTQSLIKKSTQNFNINLSQNLPAVKGSFQEIEQVIVNLISNACHALTDQKNKILVETYFNRKSGKVTINVADEGSGISTENLSKIADPFFTTKREQGGTGLGLSISCNIIHDHGGSLAFTSIIGEGTTATITLPVADKTVDRGK